MVFVLGPGAQEARKKQMHQAELGRTAAKEVLMGNATAASMQLPRERRERRVVDGAMHKSTNGVGESGSLVFVLKGIPWRMGVGVDSSAVPKQRPAGRHQNIHVIEKLHSE